MRVAEPDRFDLSGQLELLFGRPAPAVVRLGRERQERERGGAAQRRAASREETTPYHRHLRFCHPY